MRVNCLFFSVKKNQKKISTKKMNSTEDKGYPTAEQVLVSAENTENQILTRLLKDTLEEMRSIRDQAMTIEKLQEENFQLIMKNNNNKYDKLELAHCLAKTKDVKKEPFFMIHIVKCFVFFTKGEEYAKSFCYGCLEAIPKDTEHCCKITREAQEVLYDSILEKVSTRWFVECQSTKCMI